MVYEQLKLENQLCFPVYAASRLITREYQPYLDKLGITYPQYLVFMVLWEKNKITVNEITKKLMLNTNTVTPLLKRMATQGFITRTRYPEDERKVIIELTDKGEALKEEAKSIPKNLVSCLISESLTIDDLIVLKNKLGILIDHLNDK